MVSVTVKGWVREHSEYSLTRPFYVVSRDKISLKINKKLFVHAKTFFGADDADLF